MALVVGRVLLLRCHQISYYQTLMPTEVKQFQQESTNRMSW